MEQLEAIKQIAENQIAVLKDQIRELYEAKFKAETICAEKALSLMITKKEAQITVHKGYIKLLNTLND